MTPTQRCPRCERHLPEEAFQPSRWRNKYSCRECQSLPEEKAKQTAHAKRYAQSPKGMATIKAAAERRTAARRASPEIRARQRAYDIERNTRPEKLAKMSAYYASDEYKTYHAAYTAQPHVKAKALDKYLRDLYDLTLAERDAMIEAQHGRCALCLRPFGEKGLLPVVDHDHAASEGNVIVRGILHHKCNIALGHWGDDLRGVLNAVRYLTASL